MLPMKRLSHIRELELNRLEEGDDIHVPTKSTAPTETQPGTGLLSSGIDPNVKDPGMSKMTDENPKINIQNVQLATKRTTRRNDVRKALEPSSIPKTSNWIPRNLRTLP